MMRYAFTLTMMVLVTTCCGSQVNAQVAAALARLSDGSDTYTLQTRFVSLPVQTTSQLPAALLKTLESVSPNQVKVTGCASIEQSGLASVGEQQVQLAGFTTAAAQLTDVPALCIRLTDAQTKAFLSTINSNTRSNITQAPTVRVYVDQQAHVRDLASRPVVTAVHEVNVDNGVVDSVVREPVVSAVDEGLELALQVRTDENDRATVDMTALSRRLDQIVEIPVNTPKDIDGADSPEGVKLQLPSTRVSRVSAATELASGESMLVIFPGYEKQVRVERRRMLGLVKESALKSEEQWSGILVTLHEDVEP